MTFTFDLISDLHVDTWSKKFNWQDNVTSPYCVVVGDVGRDRALVLETLRHLTTCYQAVFYIDGNEEHRDSIENINHSYKTLTQQLGKIPNLVYLQDNLAVVEGVALLATNGWWNFDFDPTVNYDESVAWYQDETGMSDSAIKQIKLMHSNDAQYMLNSVKRLQSHRDVQRIVMISHTVPRPELIEHDPNLTGKLRFNVMGNSLMRWIQDADTENKIHTWCFGHYHGDVDQVRNNIRYVNNCRGRGNTEYANYAYFAKRISITY